MKLEKTQRTIDQNASMHVYFELLSKELNEAGLTMQTLLKETVDLDWTPESVKEVIWRQIQMALLHKKSTTELTTDEVTKVYEHCNRFTSKKGIGISFPAVEEE